ncbi:MAG: rRNA pseudouridine synthase [Proteobacteria bacterium]|nr:rRNA pseudouridine synthase [Pseudomonadota bacterium]MBU1647726.1 rRNA pseudouridine synthase [Pseudomonadota bacterium]
MSETVRLQKYLAGCGIASRRKAEEIIAQGRVTVDGEIVAAMGSQIDPSSQEIRLDGKLVTPHNDFLYILLNKPQGYVTTMSDPQGRPIVTSLLHGINVRLFPVGRLDLDTEGALILTNDGELAQKIQHPSYEVTKTYEARVLGRPAEKMLQKLEHGILLEGKQTAPAKIMIIARETGTSSIRITIHEGRKRQVRKMFQAIGHPVVHLKRIAYGNLFLQGLSTGKYRILSPEDLKKIFIKKIPLQKKK